MTWSQRPRVRRRPQRRALASWLPRRSRANLSTHLIECQIAAVHAARDIKLLQPESSPMRNQAATPIMLQIKNCAVASQKRIEIGDSKRETADRASLDFHINR